MAEEDVKAVVAFLRTVPAGSAQNLRRRRCRCSRAAPAGVAHGFAPRETPPTTVPPREQRRRVPGASGRPLRRVPHAAHDDHGHRQLALPGRRPQGAGEFGDRT
jgi:hypothetical protein